MSGDSLKFGTSGLRGLAVDLEGQAARRYTRAFIDHLRSLGLLTSGKIYLGRDFRPSSSVIAHDCATAIIAAGLTPIDCGTLPTPALALHAIENDSASIMVTGSHIPADRNGLKFYSPQGEVGKKDEAGINAALRGEEVADVSVELVDEAAEAAARYLARFASLLPPDSLRGWRIGVFEHSTVARDLLHTVLRRFGADTVSLGRIDGFVPVDTEAFADAVFKPLAGWLRDHRLDAIVSADGDGDRPFLMDETGALVRGDVLGLVSARFLGARTVVTPVTSNSGIERSGTFDQVLRTRVGSPFVVAAMAEASGPTVGFEANGGTFIGTDVTANGTDLPELATRDAVLPLLCVLGDAAARGQSVSKLVADLPLQHALADRLQDVPGDRSARFLERLAGDRDFVAGLFGDRGVSAVSDIDGVKITTRGGETVHFRASGNAPELRCYVEGATAEQARELLQWGLATARAQLD